MGPGVLVQFDLDWLIEDRIDRSIYGAGLKLMDSNLRVDAY